jgi:DNA-binding transcriptional LysR family regulator
MFVDAAADIIEELESLEERMLPRTRGMVGVVRLGVQPELLHERWFESLKRTLDNHPELSVELRSAIEPSDPFGSGLDLWTHFGRPAPSALVSRKLGEVQWVLAASVDYGKRRGIPRTVEDLIHHECLLGLRQGRETHWALKDTHGREQSVPVRGRFESDDVRALSAALYAGIGIGFRPKGEVQRAVAGGSLVAVLPGLRSWAIPIYLLMPRVRARIPKVRLVADLLNDTLQEMITEG